MGVFAVVGIHDDPGVTQDGLEAFTFEGAGLLAGGRIDDVVGGGEVEDAAGLDAEEFGLHVFAGVQTDVFFEFEGLLFGVEDDTLLS